MKEYIDFVSEVNEKLDSYDIVPQLSFSTNGDDKDINLHIEGGKVVLFADIIDGLYRDKEDDNLEIKDLIKKRVLNNLKIIQKQINHVFNTLSKE